MNKILTIIGREYITRVRKKSFILVTILAPLGLVALIAIMALIGMAGSEEQNIIVKDETGYIKLPDKRQLYFTYKDDPIDSLKANYKAMGFEGVLYIPAIKDLYNPPSVRYYSENQLGIITQESISQQIAQKLRDKIMEKENLDKELLRKINVDVDISTTIMGEEGERQGNVALATAAGYGVGILIYMVILIYGSMVMRGVVEEKTSRIVEIIISSVKPFQLMLGKIIGIAAVGLTQFIIWIGLYLIFNMALALFWPDLLSQPAQMPQANNPEAMEEAREIIGVLQNYNFKPLIAGFLFYFLGGYTIYASLFAAVGSAANDEGDIQSLTFPVTIPVIISFFIMMTVTQQPNTSLAFWSSIIPLSSPIVMPARLAFGVPFWELALSVILLIGGFVFTTWISGKIYRTGILMYGKKITFRELAKWVLYN